MLVCMWHPRFSCRRLLWGFAPPPPHCSGSSKLFCIPTSTFLHLDAVFWILDFYMSQQYYAFCIATFLHVNATFRILLFYMSLQYFAFYISTCQCNILKNGTEVNNSMQVYTWSLRHSDQLWHCTLQTASHYIALHCIVLHCIALQGLQVQGSAGVGAL